MQKFFALIEQRCLRRIVRRLAPPMQKLCVLIEQRR
jgi:hypothetical protein